MDEEIYAVLIEIDGKLAQIIKILQSK